jgi:hypothetical protein
MPRIAVLILLPLALSLSGCIWAPELEEVRRELEREIPGARFETEFKLTLGPASLGLARMMVGLVPDAEEAGRYLKDIYRVKLAVYRTESLPAIGELRLPGRLRRQLERSGWEVAVKVREKDEVVWILYREYRNTIRDIYIVVLDQDELVLVRLEGRLDRLFARAMEEHGDLQEVFGLE